MVEDVRNVIALLSAVKHGRSTRYAHDQFQHLVGLAAEHELLSIAVRVFSGGGRILSPIGLMETGERLAAAYENGTWGKALHAMEKRGEEVTLGRMIVAVGAQPG